jgi:hypothetical protein
MAFFAISAGTLAALIASFATPGPVSSESYCPKRDAIGLFDCCELPQSVMNEQEPERELFCPVCGMETTVVRRLCYRALRGCVQPLFRIFANDTSPTLKRCSIAGAIIQKL